MYFGSRNWSLLFIGDLSWKNPPLEKYLETKAPQGQLAGAVLSCQGFFVLSELKADVIGLSAFDLEKGRSLWRTNLNGSFSAISIWRNKRLLLCQGDNVLILGPNRVRSLHAGMLSIGTSPCLSDSGLYLFAVKSSGELAAWNLQNEEQWLWKPRDGSLLASPVPQSDGSVIFVKGACELCQISSCGKVLDSWEIGSRTRLRIDGRLNNDKLLVQAKTLKTRSTLLLIQLNLREIHNLGELLVVQPYGITSSLYVVDPSTRNIAALNSSGLVAKPRLPSPLFNGFLRLASDHVGLYGHINTRQILAANAEGKELWRKKLPPTLFDWSYLLFGSHHLILKTADGLAVWHADTRSIGV